MPHIHFMQGTVPATGKARLVQKMYLSLPDVAAIVTAET
jgi:hypothetical protein